jgi:ribonuclease H / adenosylcobalamin/alpha-ribazole phosphatase
VTNRLRVVMEADGGARGNPGPAGWGAVVRDAASGEVLLERSDAIGVATNNVAEYGGLIAGLRAAADLGAHEVEVRMDSKLVIEQMTGRWKIKHPGLRPLAAQAAALVRRFDRVDWTWIPREHNREADRLANEAMDTAAGGAGGGGKAGPPRTVADQPARAEPGPSATSRLAGSGSSWDPPDEPPTRLVLVRHGETELTAQRRYSGREDVPLTPHGRAQAEAIAGRIAALTPRMAAVVTSPLVRCAATAEAVAAATGGPPVVVEPDLIECDFGRWEGCTFAEVRQRWPDEWEAWHTSTRVAPSGGESLQQVSIRVRRAVSTLRERYPGVTVAVVSHVWPLKLMLRDALAAGDTFLHRLLLATGGLSVVDSFPGGLVAVHSVNDTSHLGGASRSGRAES